MGDNSIALLSSINNNLKLIVDQMAPKNGQSAERDKTARMSQGSLNSKNINTGSASADAKFTVGGADIKDVTSALNGLPEAVKAVAKLSGRTIARFNDAIINILRAFTTISGEVDPKQFKAVAQLMGNLNTLAILPDSIKKFRKVRSRDVKHINTVVMDIMQTFIDISNDVNGKEAKAASDLMTAVGALLGLPESIKEFRKVKDRDIKTMVNVIEKLITLISKTLRKSAISKADIAAAKMLGEAVDKLTSAIKSLPGMVIIAPIALIGVIAIFPVLMALAGIAALLGLMLPSIITGSISMFFLTGFMKRIMRVAILGVVVGLALIGLGMLLKTQWKAILFGLAGLAMVMVALTLLTVLCGALSIAVKPITIFSKGIVWNILFYVLITGLLIGLGIILKTHFVTMLVGIGGVAVVFAMMLGVMFVASLVAQTQKTMEAVGAFRSIAKLMLMTVGLAFAIIFLGKFLNTRWEYAIYGFLAVEGILIWIERLAKRAAKVSATAKAGAQALLLCEGVLGGALVLVLGVIGVAQVLINFFKDNKFWGLVAIWGVFAAVTGILTGVEEVAKLAKSMEKDLKQGAISILLCEGVLGGALVILEGIMLVAQHLEYFVRKRGAKGALSAIGEVFAALTVMVLSTVGIAKLVKKVQNDIQSGAKGLLLCEGVILGGLLILEGIILISRQLEQANGEAITLVFGALTVIILGTVGIAKMVSKQQSNIMKGALGMLLVELLLGGAIGLVYLITKVVERIEALQDGWGGITKCLIAMGAMIVGIGVLAFAAGALVIGPQAALFFAGVGVIATIELLILGITGVSLMVVKLNKQMQDNGQTFETLGATLKGAVGMFAYENLALPAKTVLLAPVLAASYLAFSPVLRALSDLVTFVSRLARNFGGMSTDSDDIVPYLGMDNAGNPIYGKPVNLIKVGSTISAALLGFTKELVKMMDAIEGQNLLRIMRFGTTIGYISDPINKFIHMLTGFVSGKDGQEFAEGEIATVTINSRGDFEYGPVVNVVKVANRIGNAISIFCETVFGDKNGNPPTWLKNMTKGRLFGKSRAERAMGVLGEIIEPISKFVDLLTGFETLPNGELRCIRFDKEGNPITDGPTVNLAAVSRAISNSIAIFCDTLFGKDATWYKKLSQNAFVEGLKGLVGVEGTRASRAMGVLARVLGPVAEFVNAMTAMGSGTNGEIVKPLYDKDGNLIGSKSVDVAAVSASIAGAIDIFVNTLFSEANLEKWKTLMGVNESGEDEGGSTFIANLGTCLGAILQPVMSFADAVSKFGFEGGQLTIPFFDEKGREVKGKARKIPIVEIAGKLASGVVAFAQNFLGDSQLQTLANDMQQVRIVDDSTWFRNGSHTEVTDLSGKYVSIVKIIQGLVGPINMFGEIMKTIGNGEPGETLSQDELNIYGKDGKKSRVNVRTLAKKIGTLFSVFSTTMIDSVKGITIDDAITKTFKSLNEIISGVIESATKMNDVDAKKLDGADSLWSHMKILYGDISGSVTDKFGFTDAQTSALTNTFGTISDVLGYFSDFNPKENGTIKAMQVFEEIVTGGKSKKSYAILQMQEKLTSIKTIDFTGITAYTGTLLSTLGFFNQTSTANGWLNTVSGAQDIPACRFMSLIIDSVKKLEVSNAEKVTKAGNAYTGYLSKMIDMSAAENTKKVTKFATAVNDTESAVLGLDTALIKAKDDRKKAIQELQDAIDKLNETVEKTSDYLSTISDKMTEIEKKNTDKFKNAISNTKSSSSGGTGGTGATKDASGNIVNNASAASGPDEDVIAAGVKKGLTGLVLNSQTIGSSSGISIPSGMNDRTELSNKVNDLISILSNLDFVIQSTN